jgi:hypothetical protein
MELIPIETLDVPGPFSPSAGLLIVQGPKVYGMVPPWLLWTESYLHWQGRLVDGALAPHYLGWAPERPAGSALRSPPVAWLRRDAESLELACIDSAGSLHWADIPLNGGTPSSEGTVQAQFTPPYQGYRAATIVRPGFVTGVTARDGIHWLRRSGARPVLESTTWTAFPSAVACFPSAATNELLVVCDGGEVVRLPVPQ